MENNEQHINDIFKQKFEGYQSKPPERVWEGIAAALDSNLAPAWYTTLYAKIAAALVVIALLIGGYWLVADILNPVNTEAGLTIDLPIDSIDDKRDDNHVSDQNISSTIDKTVVGDNALLPETASAEDSKPIQKIDKPETVFMISSEQSTVTEEITSNNSLSEQQEGSAFNNGALDLMNYKTIAFNNELPSVMISNRVSDDNSVTEVKQNVKSLGRWALSLYFTPGFIFNSFDSLTIQNSYALSFEPVYYFNNHWFIRPGLGLQYSRDKGFVKADYLSWDYLGSYDDVVDVTIDSSGGVYTPVYHTQTRDIYDSIRHITISEETNRYLYLQTSVVFGYHNHTGKFGWSVYAGPSVSFVLLSKQDNPVDDDANVISLDYNLPIRKSPQYHFKFGLGLDYAIGKNWLVSVEPEYRYYINGIKGGDIYSNPLSGLDIRFGFIYTLKR